MIHQQQSAGKDCIHVVLFRASSTNSQPRTFDQSSGSRDGSCCKRGMATSDRVTLSLSHPRGWSLRSALSAKSAKRSRLGSIIVGLEMVLPLEEPQVHIVIHESISNPLPATAPLQQTRNILSQHALPPLLLNATFVMRIPIFRIFYSTTFTILVLLLTALLLITPGDHIYQAFSGSQLYNIFIVAGAHLLTLLIAAFIYAGRLYANRSVLAAVPRELNLYEKGKGNGVPRRVRRLVREGLERSAWIAWVGRPRDIRGARNNAEGGEVGDHGNVIAAKPSSRPSTAEKQLSQVAGSAMEPPVWGTISHPGWSSPESTDLPNLHLPPIILELPHLIEAKAVSLTAPSIPLTHSDQDPTGLGINDKYPEIPLQASPSPLATSLLQRPATMGLREYLSQLSSLGLINPPSLTATFLAKYEHARFSGSEISETVFRALMGVFAEILRGMKSPSPQLIKTLKAAEEQDAAAKEAELLKDDQASRYDYGSDGAQGPDRDAHPRASMETTSTVAHTPLPAAARSSTSLSSTASPRSNGSGNENRGLRTPSIPSIRMARSLRSKASSVFTGRSSERSVIHLAEERGVLDLPYVIDGGGG